MRNRYKHYLLHSGLLIAVAIIFGLFVMECKAVMFVPADL